MTTQNETLKAIRRGEALRGRRVDPIIEGSLRNPARVRGKGCGGSSSLSKKSVRARIRRTPTCGVCGGKGHNRKSCHVQKKLDILASAHMESNGDDSSDDDDGPDCDLFANVDMVCYLVLNSIVVNSFKP